MLRRLLPLALMIGGFAFIFLIPEPGYIPPLIVVSNDYFVSSLSNEGVKQFEAALARAYPEWAALRIREGEQEWSLGTFLQIISGPGRRNAVSPEVLVVTVGMKYRWQIPQNRDLARVFIRTGVQMTEDYAAFLNQPEIRQQHPQVGNAATYALYRYFNGDMQKLQAWRQSYIRIFGIDPVIPWRPQKVQQRGVPVRVVPFMERPFELSTTLRYPVRSFIDHYWPLWKDPDDRLHRFDGRIFSFVIGGVSAYSSHQGIDYALSGVAIYPVAEGVVFRPPDARCGEVLVYHQTLGILT